MRWASRCGARRPGCTGSRSGPTSCASRGAGAPRRYGPPGVDRGYLSADALAAARLPAGHLEGYFEAFANIYRDFAAAVRGNPPARPCYAGLADGIAHMRFIQAAHDSSAQGAAWVEL
ncbi:MAG: hypothetical protein WDN44_08520 [Sphingomonas sp.]